uniref:Uncharacterized protein n=1 Tax=Romanomermis culicivorax TaxID=13658 RepID=A0A915JQY2_ROMCU
MKKGKLLPKKLLTAVASRGKKKRNEVAPKNIDQLQNETVEDSRELENQKGEVSLKSQDEPALVKIKNHDNVVKPEDEPCCSHCSSYSQPDDEIVVIPSSSNVKESIPYQQQKGIGIYYANDDRLLSKVDERKVEEKSESDINDRGCNKSLVQSSSGCSTSPSIKSPLSDQEPCSSEDPIMNDDRRRGSTRIKKIPISEARAKTYLAGHHFNRNEMMNDDEIRKYFPDGRAVVYIGTYNVAEKGVPAESLRDWLLAEDFAHAADIYAIGIQEAPLNS